RNMYSSNSGIVTITTTISMIHVFVHHDNPLKIAVMTIPMLYTNAAAFYDIGVLMRSSNKNTLTHRTKNKQMVMKMYAIAITSGAIYLLKFFTIKTNIATNNKNTLIIPTKRNEEKANSPRTMSGKIAIEKAPAMIDKQTKTVPFTSVFISLPIAFIYTSGEFPIIDCMDFPSCSASNN